MILTEFLWLLIRNHGARRNDIFQVLKEENCPSRILDPVRMFSRNEDKIKNSQMKEIEKSLLLAELL